MVLSKWNSDSVSAMNREDKEEVPKKICYDACRKANMLAKGAIHADGYDMCDSATTHVVAPRYGVRYGALHVEDMHMRYR